MISQKDISQIILGTMQFLWTTTEKEAFKILDTYYELGGNAIDTADIYTNWVEGLKGGEAETIIGKWIKQKRNREKIFFTTKVRGKMWEGNDGEGLSKAHIIKAIDGSLKRLQTEYIDLYLSHWSDEKTPIEETLSAYQTLIAQGKVRFIGCSNYSTKELNDALNTGGKLRTQYSFIQAYYNLLDRKNFEEQLLSIIKQRTMTCMIYGPLASGFLSGAYRKGKPMPTHARAAFMKDKMIEENFKMLEVIENIGKKYNATIAQVSLAWLINKGYFPITGADSIEQIVENMGARQLRLRREDLELLNKLTLLK